ncbi:alpha/beta hydrolase [Streptomyces hygroscopicus]|uniref:alpha/beta hydrolase n=1 Tax=Streptomyces hygroscopicus TaxID=1912 RepID=UPI001FCC88AD|nr:alpha/beta hydrolase [Streptomyces hygroscopicus]BDH09232.1 alpha/beta hydrolase [Streptomyces hygroscopicus]
MVSLAQLRKLKPSEFEEAADGWHKVSSAAGEAKDRVDNEIVATLRRDLKGDVLDAALGRLRRLSRNFQYTQVESGLIRTALNGLASELRSAQRKLNDALADAEAEKFTVNPDGSVHWVSQRVQLPFHPEQTASADSPRVLLHSDPQQAKAQACADRIAGALEDANEVDSRYSRTLDRLKADNDLNVTNADWVDAQGDMSALRKSAGEYLQGDDIPKGKSPVENARWWKGLSADEKSAYTSLFPASIGALDGIPAEVRDEANRTVFAEKRAECKVRLDAMPPEPWPKWVSTGGPYASQVCSDEWQDWNSKYHFQELDAADKGMDAIQKRLDATGTDGLPEAYLLGFSPDGNGRAIIANGNPDTADHTAVYVPGTSSNLSGIDGDIRRMTDLWRTTGPMAGGQSVSTVTWLGYDAPQKLGHATQIHYAEDGAPAFSGFIDGLKESHESGTGGHLTAIGHSYGTTLIGSAARQGELNADDVVFGGSPGVRVGNALDLDVPQGHVWNQEAAGDPVPGLGRWGHGGAQWKIGGGAFIIPSDELFGANQMSTDTTGHSDYWKYGKHPTESLQNQAAVTLGQYEEVKRAR